MRFALLLLQGTWLFENGASTSSYWAANPGWYPGEPNNSPTTSGGIGEQYAHVYGNYYALNDAPDQPVAT